MRVQFSILALVTIMMLGTQGCTDNGQLATNLVSDSQYENVKKLESGQYTLIANQELMELKHEAELGKSVGRYQIHPEGFRTWRLDTSTGQICLLLTSEEDWKDRKIAAQGCNQ
jgi:hypothetical protein